MIFLLLFGFDALVVEDVLTEDWTLRVGVTGFVFAGLPKLSRFLAASTCFCSSCFLRLSASYSSFVIPSRLFMVLISSSVRPIGMDGLFLASVLSSTTSAFGFVLEEGASL